MLLEVAEELAPRAKGLPRYLYSPDCRQEVFSETQLPIWSVLKVRGLSKHSRDQQRSPSGQQDARSLAHPVTRWGYLFEQDEPRNSSNPQ